MDPHILIEKLQATKEYFDRSSRCLEEGDSAFAPAEGMMTAAQQVAHVAQTIDWFVAGAFRPEGFDLNFEQHAEEIAGVTSLAAARDWLHRSFAAATETLGGKSAEDLAVPLPAGPVMGGAPRFAIVSAIDDHTAHHRGVLTVYARLRGHTPAMPYMDA